jgi:ankyrin repeat protein
MIAAQFGRTDALQMLLARRAKRELTDKLGRTAVDLATENHNDTIVALLRNGPR